MPTITDELSFGGAIEKIRRLGLSPLYQELRGIITGFTLNVLEERTRKGANSAAEVRVMFDWSKCLTGALPAQRQIEVVPAAAHQD